MADERGQVWQLQAAVWQVLVDRETRPRARIRRAIAARPGREGGQFSGSLNLGFSGQMKGTVSLVNAFYVTNGTQTIIFAIFVSMNPPSVLHTCRGCVWMDVR